MIITDSFVQAHSDFRGISVDDEKNNENISINSKISKI